MLRRSIKAMDKGKLEGGNETETALALFFWREVVWRVDWDRI
jgi:hypothetical protein